MTVWPGMVPIPKLKDKHVKNKLRSMSERTIQRYPLTWLSLMVAISLCTFENVLGRSQDSNIQDDFQVKVIGVYSVESKKMSLERSGPLQLSQSASNKENRNELKSSDTDPNSQQAEANSTSPPTKKTTSFETPNIGLALEVTTELKLKPKTNWIIELANEFAGVDGDGNEFHSPTLPDGLTPHFVEVEADAADNVKFAYFRIPDPKVGMLKEFRGELLIAQGKIAKFEFTEKEAAKSSLKRVDGIAVKVKSVIRSESKISVPVAFSLPNRNKKVRSADQLVQAAIESAGVLTVRILDSDGNWYAPKGQGALLSDEPKKPSATKMPEMGFTYDFAPLPAEVSIEKIVCQTIQRDGDLRRVSVNLRDISLENREPDTK